MKFNILCPACSDKIETEGEKMNSSTFDALLKKLSLHIHDRHANTVGDMARIKIYDEYHDGYPVFDQNGTQLAFPMAKGSKVSRRVDTDKVN